MQSVYRLPSQPTPFIGRESEVTELIALLNKPDRRLLSLVGPGGTGKTRLALEVAGRLSDSFRHGVVFVALAPLHSGADIASAVVNSLGIHIGDAATPRDALVMFLRQREMLLILDNFEHVLDGVDLITEILAAAPAVRIITTSREVLNLQEEWVVPVRGLRFPEDDEESDPGTYGALALFAERAVRVQHDFSLDDDYACAVQICRLVGGMPLALELAASWLKTLTCDEIVSEIHKSIDILATSVRNIEERHRSIRTVFDHSWQMCTPSEQAVFGKLCVFRGGFERDAAEAVAGASLLTLSALVEKSMLWKLPSGRYKIHELLRQYAEEKLDESGDTASIQQAHCDYYARFMQTYTEDIKGRRQLDGLNAIDNDFGNVRVAWTHAIKRSDINSLDRMMEGVALFCDMRARYQVGEAMLERAMTALEARAASDDDVCPVWNRLRARWIQVWILQERSPLPDAIIAHLEKCLALATEQDDRETVALCLWSTGELNRFERARDYGIPAYERALAAYKALDDSYYVVRVLRGMVHCYFFAMSPDHWQTMIDLNEQHLTLAQSIGDRTGMAHAVYYDGSISLFMPGSGRGDGVSLLREALAIWEEMGDRKSIGVVLTALGMFAWLRGDDDQADELLEQAQKIAEDVNFLNTAGMAMSNQGFLAMLAGDLQTAKQLCEASLQFHHSPSTTFNRHLAQLGLAMVAIETGEVAQARSLLSQVYQAVRFPLAKFLLLPVAAFLLAEDGERISAVKLLSLAATYPGAIRNWMTAWDRLTELHTSLIEKMGQAAYDLAWQQGAQLKLDEALQLLSLSLTQADSSVLSSQDEQTLADPLSERELEVLYLLAQGLSNREIADRLVLAVGTVKVHTRNIYSKLDVSNRTEAAMIARQLNLI